MKEKLKDIKPKYCKRKKRIKWILVWLWLIVIFWLLLYQIVFFIHHYIPGYIWLCLPMNLWQILLILSIWISMYIEIMIVYLIVLRKLKGKIKLKKYLKFILIIILPFLLFLSRIEFTKVWIIPNWLWTEALRNCIDKVCVDCKGRVILHWPMFNGADELPEVNWNFCCPWTFKYNINNMLN